MRSSGCSVGSWSGAEPDTSPVSKSPLPDPSVFMPTFKEHRRCWEAVVDASEGSIVRVEVPYRVDEVTRLPAPSGQFGSGPAHVHHDQWQR